MQSTPETTENAIAKAYSTGEDLNVIEQLALEAYLLSFVLLAECDFRLYRDGLISFDDWAPTRFQIKLYFVAPDAQTWWRKIVNQQVSAEFRAEVDAVLVEMDGKPNPYDQSVMMASNESLEADV
jgi:hypothetical protein